MTTMTSLKNTLKTALLALALAAGGAQADVVTNIYSGFTAAGSGTPFTGYVGSLTTSSINFATETGYAWHPFGLFEFGAESFTDLDAASSKFYTFTVDSDDGAKLYIDGTLLVDSSDPHGPATVSGSAFLTAGKHLMHVEFFECCGGASGLDVSMSDGLTLTPAVVPEPGALPLVGLSLIGLGLVTRRRRSQP